MPKFGPISRRDLIRYLRQLGFEGPYPGGKHHYMIRETIRLAIPNPHQGDIGRGLLHRLLQQANVSREIWENL
ncbi:MAG: type II toxin-antitoxin system HicA family toxin [Gemmatimonadetes bacterium]|nr:type II toxin-antitoxin system HicA family toxin [Gemmatimonadota bacterium]MYB55228.1 type II toxin-antitoxin system HicA family toxin [Gemmatimonadota bacterium]